jgi:hypothetical protein
MMMKEDIYNHANARRDVYFWGVEGEAR